MSVYASLVEKTILPVGDAIAGGGFTSWLRKYRREQGLNARELEAIESARLSEMLRHARTAVKFYSDISGTRPDPLDDLRQFPIVTKRTINQNLDQILTRNKSELIAVPSSGSSGFQGTIYVDRSARASQRAMQMLWFEWAGYKVGDSILQTGMTLDRGVIKRAKDFFLNTEYVPAFPLDGASARTILQKLSRTPRQCLFGYASSLYLLARAAVDAGIDTIRFERAVSWGDKLFPHYRKAIKSAFGCETIDTYGCTEGAMVAAQCADGRYHLSINQCVVEVVDDDDSPVPPGTMGHVLVTRLDNFAMPLIRYRLGDLAVLEPRGGDRCTCGRQSPLLRQVVGRETDIISTRSGKRMIVHFFTGIFEHIPAIEQFKVVQRHLDEIEIQYIARTGCDEHVLKNVELKIHEYLGEPFPIRWVRTEAISSTPSGKPQIVESFIKSQTVV